MDARRRKVDFATGTAPDWVSDWLSDAAEIDAPFPRSLASPWVIRQMAQWLGAQTTENLFDDILRSRP
ncbi:hypothetical protein B5K11_31135 [Rhizobium leguminosarum bv. trifolii]|nr:hypothetical protein B5K11_31135 [Rhizobium leguminosarum bv. trifolii]